MTAQEYFELGNKYRKEGNFQLALNNYQAAIALDPESPAVEAREMLVNIFNYYCKDMYNP
jgi:tetratricopeptide (TPR) repeat protein